ncbi:MAG TPA: hypothetical protein VFS83_07465 [Ktedonobacterales bacterium]|nr:hypothetical protein [Ktedonobacterales bacterium]
MRTFLDRYKRGEHEQVWSELDALGEAALQEPLVEDTLAVVHETMRRARHNIEALIPLLVTLGYQFGYGWIQPGAEESYAYDSLKQYMRRMDWAREQPPVFLPADEREWYLAEINARLNRLHELGAPVTIIQDIQRRHDAFEARPTMRDRISFIERYIGRLPPTISAWFEIVGSVNFVGHHPRWVEVLPAPEPWPEGPFDSENEDMPHPMYRLDPLVIAPLERSVKLRDMVGFPYGGMPPGEPVPLPSWSGFNPLDPLRVDMRHLDWAEQRRASGEATDFVLCLAQNPFSKYDGEEKPWLDDCFMVSLPQNGVDARMSGFEGRDSVWDGITFVDYLRECFRWGGFPGWARLESRPVEDLAFLTRDLLPL